ncbi:response regulator [Microbacterium elymi]|uniref:Response regulator transcription factor n=1 Tax=Microbacterium elymi TaxID=2909587 RepID=A0ABY5NJZ7_9MICO|nr:MULTISPECIES: response regulator transcription factor [Microbacterium]UUT35446.1 response regulator transcription factor [Microbacterium elymi]
MIRVLIADDQLLVRTGFRLILDLESDMDVVGEAADGRECLDVAHARHPDVVLMDIRMPVMDGIEATRRLSAEGGGARILILTTFDADEYVYDALRAGATGFLLKDAPREQLVSAIRQVAAGDALLAPTITRRLIERYAGRPSEASANRAFATLTDREAEVLRLVAQGLSNAEIAMRLYLGETTVKTHVARMLAKLGVRDRVQAVVLAYESGFVRSGGDPAPGRPGPL